MVVGEEIIIRKAEERVGLVGEVGGGGSFGTDGNGTNGGSYGSPGVDSSSNNQAGCGGGSFSQKGGSNNYNYTNGGDGSNYGGGGGAASDTNSGNNSSNNSGGAGGNGTGGGGGGAGGGNGGNNGVGVGGGGGGSGGGKGAMGGSSDIYYMGGDGGFGINCSGSIINLYNQQCSLNNNYFGPLYFTGNMPTNYYIVILNENTYGQLFIGPESKIIGSISKFYLATSSYANIATIMEIQSVISFNSVFYNNNNNYSDNIILGSYPSFDNPSFFLYNGFKYTYYLSNGSTESVNSIDLNITKTDLGGTLYSQNSITTSTLNLFGNLSLNPDYSNTILGIQMGTIISTFAGSSLNLVIFPKPFPSSKIMIQLTPISNYEDTLYNPQLGTITSTYFNWYNFAYSASTGITTGITYSVQWMAICYI